MTEGNRGRWSGFSGRAAAFVRSCHNSLRRLFVRAVKQHVSPVQTELIDHLGESIRSCPALDCRWLRSVFRGLAPLYGSPNAYEASHHFGCELAHVGHDAGRPSRRGIGRA